MTVSLVVVCHRSSGVLGECVRAFRAEARAAGVEHEVVAVEQTEDPAEAERVAAAGVDRLEVRPNRGYAAGLNAGAAVARGDTLVLANPDTVLGAGSLARLLDAVASGFDVVGPQLVWDDAAELLFPPAEDPSPVAELRRTAQRRWQRVWAVGMGRTIAEWWRVWTADGPIEMAALRGPLLVVNRAAMDRFGPLDEGYFLYYEETEWLRRARRRGARLALHGGAVAIHRAGHSARHAANRAAVEAVSRERFFARNYGPAWRWLLRRLAPKRTRTGVDRAVPVSGPEAVPPCGGELWLLSTFRHLMPAVGVVGRPTLPRAVATVADGGPWYAAAARRRDDGWALGECWMWEAT